MASESNCQSLSQSLSEWQLASDYLDIQAHIHCTHGHFSQLQMVTSVNYGQLASDAITSTPVNLDG